ncbi:hypothetical protein [Phenylobacterium sp.]|uniref:hypothetical protein n=1 Tax=Phenylobacterium sp. TaxID=1871053 RepID=UPI0035B2D490
MRTIPLVLAAVLASAGAASAAPAPRLPAAVQAYVAELNKSCREYGGAPTAAPNLVKVADLNGDGLPDYLVNVGAYSCEGAASAMGAGQFGADVEIFAGGPGGTAAKAYENAVYDAEIVTKAGKTEVWLMVSGEACGQKNAINLPFSDWKACKRSLVWNAAKRQFVFAPLSMARPVE